MANFESFLISDFVEGEISKRTPWLLPPDGFEELDNCNLKRGALVKRRGRSLLGQVVAINTATLNPTLQTNPITGIDNHLSGNTEELIIFDKNRMNTFVSSKSSGIILLSVADVGGSPNVVRFTVASGHGFSADEVGTISNWPNYNETYRVEAVAAETIDIEHAFVNESAPATAQINQEQFTDASKLQLRFDSTGQNFVPAVGETVEQVVAGTNPTGEIERIIVDYGSFASNNAVGTLIIVRGTETDQFETSGQLFKTATGNIIGNTQAMLDDGNWTGDNTNFFWIANWTLSGASRTYISNNNDPMMIYDGTDVTQLNIDIGTDAARAGVNDVDSAMLVFIHKERIVIFSTVENGTSFNQRSRWSGIKQPQSWPTSNFKDAPTEDFIISGGFLGDDLYIWFEKSVWRFAWTGDSVNPFEWERVSSTDGAIAQMSLTVRNNIQRAIGPTKILANNGNIIGPIDEKIPDVVLEWNPDSAAFSSSVDVEEERQIYYAYARPETEANADGNKYPDRLLVQNYEDNNWAVFSHLVHAMGSSSLESDVTWDLDDAWEDIDFAWATADTVSGFPFTVMGDHSGKVFQLNTGGSDDGAAIEFNAKTARFNPYSKEGLKAMFWKVEFLCDVDPDVSFDVEFFINSEITKYKTTTIVCSAVKGSDVKAWHTAFSNTIGEFHSLNLTNNASGNRPIIHAIRLWFKRAGRSGP